MTTRNQNVLFLSRFSALLLLVVFVLVAAVAARSNVRVDLTEEGLYTLNDASRNVLASLEDPASIQVFWHKVPESSETTRRYVDSLLGEMKSVAGDRLTVRWVDLDGEEGKKEAQDADVQPRPIQDMKAGEIRVVEIYDSLVIQVADESQVVHGLLGGDHRLEYEIISRLHKMTQTEETVVGLVAPRPAYNPFGGAQGGRFRNLEAVLRQQFGGGFRSHVSLDQPVPPDIRVLVVVAPVDLEETAVFNFEQFLLGGGRAALLLDPVHASLGQAPKPQADDSGFGEWLADLGVTLESGVVGDYASFLSRPRVFQSPLGQVVEYIRYPFWVRVSSDTMDPSNPATSGFGQLPLYWPAAISLDEAKHEAAERTATTLGTTTIRGYRRPDLIGLDTADRDPVGMEDLEAHLPLMVLVEGPMTSFWKGRTKPGEEEDEEGESAPDETAPDETAPDETESEEEPSEGGDDAEEDDDDEEDGPPRLDDGAGLLVVIGDAEMVSDDVVRLGRQYVYGFDFMLNLVDWMGGSEDLLALRSRAREDRAITEVKAEQQDLIKWGHIVVIPLLALLAGIVVFIVRRYQR